MGSKVAVKVINDIDEYVKSSGCLNVLSKLPQHMNIVQSFGLSFKDKVVSIVFEYMKDGCVLDVLRERGFNTTEKYDIAQQISAGVWHLHENNWIHKNLALRNILINLSEPMRVVITDFYHSRILKPDEDHIVCRTGQNSSCVVSP
eukprot:UN05825